MVIRLLISALLVAGLAMADTAAAAKKQKATVSKQDCRWLVSHRPAADVAFKPGVDVRGRPVKSADLGSTRRIKLPRVIAIPLTVPLGSLVKSDASSLIGESEVGVGLVTVDRESGEVTYEGQSLVPAERRRLPTACRKLLRRK